MPTDSNTNNSYLVEVTASDGKGGTAVQTIIANVTNLDEVAPTITSGTTATAIDENSGANQTVYTATSTDTADIATGSTTYSLKSGSDAGLSINPSTGAVTLSTNPDFETKSSYSFTVIATDAANNAAEKAVTLAINNKDEVAPTITSGATATAIDENSGANQTVYTATSTDTADIATGSTTYSLKSGSDAGLSINPSTGAVTLSTNPDFETKSSYSFTVIATDAANNAAEKAVTLAINNKDEVAPTITSGATATAIDENSGANQVVYTATSTDTADIATGATTYSLKAGSDAGLSINASTGAVTLATNPDFETKSSYSFTVIATDAANHAAEKAVTLAINNKDEVAPTITSGAIATAIDENSGANQTIYTATSTDNATGAITYSLKAGSDAGLSINPGTGAVTLATNPDFEVKSSYSFTVIARDAANNAAEKAVILSINNKDEVAPTITSGATATAIGENSGANQTIYTATSTDTADIATGSTTYSLKAGSDAGLSINASTGAVTLSTNPDFETKSSYSFTVIATDAANNAAEKAVTLAINNKDEVAPTITSGATATAIDENSGANQVVYTATSTDTADIATGATTYSLKAGSDAGLSINPGTGAVTLATNPDFEVKSSYSFTVIARDAANNAAEKAVILSINNKDEVAPTITSGATATAIGENSGANQTIYTATSTDTADIATGSTTYSLKAGSDAGLTINPSTGAVTLTTNPDFKSKPSYSFTVIVTDAANNAAEQAVTLAIKKSQTAPTITSNGAGATAAIDMAELHTAVTTVTATDADNDPLSYSITGGVDQGKFSIDSTSGALKFIMAPNVHTPGDSDGNNSYLVEVSANDGRGGSGMQAITVTVRSDIDRDGIPDNIDKDLDNDGKPDFVDDPVPNVIGDGTGDGNGDGTPDSQQPNVASIRTVGTADAAKRFASIEVANGLTLNNIANTVAPPGLPRNAKMPLGQFDFDIGNINPPGASVTVSIYVDKTLGMNGYYKFNGKTWTNIGSVSTVGNKSKITFSLTDGGPYDSDGIANGTIKDPGGPTVVGTLITSNGGEPTASVSISENSHAVTTVQAELALTYSLTGGADLAKFTIDPTSGALRFTNAPDFEKAQDLGDTAANNTYVVQVTASDAQSSSDTQTLTIRVTDVNEAPTVTSGASAAVAHNSPAGTLVYSTTASDPDSGDTLTYSLSGTDANLLNINPATGAVTLKTTADINTKPGYSFTVTASDKGALSASKAITVQVSNVQTDTFTPAPTIELASGSDTGVSDSDKLINKAAIALTGQAEALATVTVSDAKGNAIGSTQASQNGVWNLAGVNLATLGNNAGATGADGLYTLSAKAVDLALNQSTTNTLTIELDATAPPAPLTLQLDAASDSTPVGDGKTSNLTPNFTVTLPQGATSADRLSFKADQATLSTNTLTAAQLAAGSVTLNIDAHAFPDNRAITFAAALVDKAGNTSTSASTTVAFITDFDGLTPATETAGSATGDFNADGLPDSQQNDVATAPLTNAQDFNNAASGNAGSARYGALIAGDANGDGVPDSQGSIQLSDVGVSPVATAAGGLTLQNLSTQGLIASSDVINFTATADVNKDQSPDAGGFTDADPSRAGVQVRFTLELGGGVAATRVIKVRPDGSTFDFTATSGNVDGGQLIDTNGDGKPDRIILTITDNAAGDFDARTGIIADPLLLAKPNTAPEFTSYGGAAAASLSVAENTTTVATLSASDADNDVPSFSISGGLDASKFTLNSTTGALRFISAPDFEKPADSDQDNVYHVTIQASDGLGGLASQALAVKVTDVADTGVITPAPKVVDGVTLSVQSDIDMATNLEQQTLSIAAISPSRVEDTSTPNANLADIGLDTSMDTAAIYAQLAAALPIGVAMTASGPVTLLSATQASTDLLGRINQKAATPEAASDMLAAAQSFLTSLGGSSVLDKTLTLTASTTPNDTPLLMGNSAKLEAIVLDARGLPANSTVQLDNVDFSAVLGALRVTGGAGHNRIVGDASAQWFAMGAGNDTISGGAGNDVLSGARSDVGQWQFYLDANGTIQARYQATQIAASGLDSKASDASFLDLRFLSSPTATVKQVVFLYQAAFGREADLGGLNFCLTNQTTPEQLAKALLNAAEWSSVHGAAASAMGNDAFVNGMYQTALGRAADAPGRQFWLDAMNKGMGREQVLLGFAQSAEMQTHLNTSKGYLLVTYQQTGEKGWILGSGDDRLDGGSGSDVLVGGDGVDTVVYPGALPSYKFLLTKGGEIKVADTANGTLDTLRGFELGEFNGQQMDIGFTQATQTKLNTLGLLYQTLLDRPADVGGLNFWLKSDWSAQQYAQGMLVGKEFVQRNGNGGNGQLSDKAFVELLYRNSLARDADAAGLKFWSDYLGSGHSRAEMVEQWIQAAEVVGVQYGTEGLWLV